MFSRILVPLDGSRLAERAVAHAETIAKIFGAQVVLLRVLDPGDSSAEQQSPEPLNWQIRKAEADVYLKEVAARLRENEITVETELLEGKTPESITDFARSGNFDLLILTTHGASGFSRWSTSGNFQKVVSKAYQNILVVRPYLNGEVEEARPVYERILLPVDSSRRAECAIPAATTIARANDSTLLLAAVISPPDLPIPVPYPDEVRDLVDRLMLISRESAQNYLQEMQNRLDVRAETRLVENESVFLAIHELAESEDAGLLVFCAHGRTGRFNWPYGSVVSNYIEHGARPVLVIQDVPLAQVKPTPAEQAAEKYGRR